MQLFVTYFTQTTRWTWMKFDRKIAYTLDEHILILNPEKPNVPVG